MEKLIICETDRGRYAVRPMSWAGIWNEKGQIQESLNHLALFIEKKGAEKFVEWKEEEEQGKLLKLPVAVGDMVYHLCAFSSGESEIIEMKVCCVEPCGAIRNHKGICEVWNVYAETDYTKGYFKFFDFGKTVFLTRPGAERALAEMEGKK